MTGIENDASGVCGTRKRKACGKLDFFATVEIFKSINILSSSFLSRVLISRLRDEAHVRRSMTSKEGRAGSWFRSESFPPF